MHRAEKADENQRRLRAIESPYTNVREKIRISFKNQKKESKASKKIFDSTYLFAIK